ncbi:very short patch repair endonuclease [Amycolatopsis sp. CA-230715]|uniref:very short patch repair endonuclease n=1 Tax=Amycolatopsis sp. CA-230715 TaxID=2745196 RepID=UPI0020B4071F|nr:very short patch repair endonuclease [Amycolatopsis sp. CA-230715]
MNSTSWASSPVVRRVMRANTSRDTGPERAVRRLVHAAGLRYRVDARPEPSLRRRADLVFTRARVAVFVDGCFWHGCPAHYSPPGTNSGYWAAKIAANAERDAETTALLRDAGWTVLRGWEHEPARDLAARVVEAVRGARR